MQSKWGPRIFWLVVFSLAGLAVYVMFSDPGDEDVHGGYSTPLVNLVTINPRLGGCEIKLGMQDRTSTNWKGNIQLGQGKILQFYVSAGHASSVTAGSRFDCKSEFTDERRQPVILHLVYLADADDTLSLTVGKETQSAKLADLQKQPQSLLNGTVRLQQEVPQQLYDSDSNSDDMLPVVAHDSKNQPYLLYVNAERSKGMDVNSLLSGSFESLENPITSVVLRLSTFQDGGWQLSETVTPKLESCLDPALAIDLQGRIYVAWLQKSLDGWDLFYTLKEPKGSWSKPARLTKKSGAMQHLVAGADTKGRVWLAWQTCQESYYDIYAMVFNDDKHPLRNPGQVAERSRQLDGRWFPALAADALGNMYLAWSVFNSGHFDLEVLKLGDAAAPSKPMLLKTASLDALRPTLACDRDNQLWIAYEQGLPVAQFGEAHLPRSQIQVRTIRADGSITDWPLLKERTEPTKSVVPASAEPSRCSQPHLLFSPEGVPFVSYQSNQRLYCCQWQDQGWSEAKWLSEWSPAVQSRAPVVYQSGHLIGIHETLDMQGRVRLAMPAAAEASKAMTLPSKLTSTLPSDASNWKPFSELARQFRKRSDEQVLNKRYLLRGMVLLPRGVAALGNDPWMLAALATEQAYYDWIMIPHDPQAPVTQQWLNAQRAHSINQGSDRNYLLGYYRPLIGQRESLLHIDTKKDEWPLPPLSQVDRFRKPSERDLHINASEADDRTMIKNYINLRQRLSFQLTDDWRMLAALTKPGGPDATSNSIERTTIPLWHPEVLPASPGPLGLRVVAMANGKSYEQLLDALRERHFYVATDDIYALVNCDKHLPGDVFQSYFKPTISVIAQGTSKLKAVEIWQDNKLIKSEQPPGNASILEYSYSEPDRIWHSYTVRIVQENGAEAIVQPFWIRYIP